MNQATPKKADTTAALKILIEFAPPGFLSHPGVNHWRVTNLANPDCPKGSDSLTSAIGTARQVAIDWLQQEQVYSELPREPDYSAPALLEAGVKHMRARARLRDAPDGERSMARTVAAFNALYDKDLTEEEGWMLMVLLKQSRASQGDFNRDDYEDGAAYFGLAGEAAANERAPLE